MKEDIPKNLHIVEFYSYYILEKAKMIRTENRLAIVCGWVKTEC